MASRAPRGLADLRRPYCDQRHGDDRQAPWAHSRTWAPFLTTLYQADKLPGNMRCYKAQEFAGCYDLKLLPESRKLADVSGHEIISTGSICALQKHIVVWVASHLNSMSE